MADEQDITEIWRQVMTNLETDYQIEGLMKGFVMMAVPKGVMGGVMYLEVANDLARDTLQARLRVPLTAAMAKVEGAGISSFSIVVNPELKDQYALDDAFGGRGETREGYRAAGLDPLRDEDARAGGRGDAHPAPGAAFGPSGVDPNTDAHRPFTDEPHDRRTDGLRDAPESLRSDRNRFDSTQGATSQVGAGGLGAAGTRATGADAPGTGTGTGAGIGMATSGPYATPTPDRTPSGQPSWATQGGYAGRDVRDPDDTLNPKDTFDNFLIGRNNQFAHAAATAAAEAPAKAYNPLFIYGESGLGKTHLLHAIGHHARSMFPGIRVRYVSSEEFTNDFINSIANNQSFLFQSRYREVDILLVDDIQFLQGRDSTQEAFFHTFNSLHDHNRQVVITSDVPPRRLTGFGERMRSRFEWGLTMDMFPPDRETRLAILRKKAKNDGLRIPDDALEYIAEVIDTNIRELEGTLIRVTAYANLTGHDIDLTLVKSVLKDIVPAEDRHSITSDDIINAVVAYYKVPVEDLFGSQRSQAIAGARQVAMYLCRQHTDMSLPKIGQLFGGRDHTTVMYANRKVSELMKERRSVYNQVTELTEHLRSMQRRPS